MISFFYYYYFFTYSTSIWLVLSIENAGQMNAKYCDTLSGKYNNTLYGTINTNRLMIWFQYLILDLEIFSDSQGFIFTGTVFHNFAPRFIIDSLLKKTVREFLVDRWTPLLVSESGFSKN